MKESENKCVIRGVTAIESNVYPFFTLECDNIINIREDNNA